MKPAFSVIFFTVGSGAGLGLFSLLVLADLFGGNGAGMAPFSLLPGLTALALVAGGLFASTFHLARPKNAWRALGHFRTSWLSREGVFAALFFPPAIAYLALGWLATAPLLRLFGGIVALLLAWATIYSTGMIYACLKTIRQWHSPLVPALYLVLAHSSGALLFCFLMAVVGAAAPAHLGLTLGALALGALLKAIYYVWIARPAVGPSPNTATGLARSTVRLLDTGHSHGNFVSREFGFVLAPDRAGRLKALVFLFAFALPGLLIASGSPAAGALAVVCGFAGLLLERWLFFAEARHVVRLYHGLAT
ncbi:MAG: dimethyl sulfoxide reductase anchor subunit family protein [Bacteroidota bacterium]